jgi:hypothetical protein
MKSIVFQILFVIYSFSVTASKGVLLCIESDQINV